MRESEHFFARRGSRVDTQIELSAGSKIDYKQNWMFYAKVRSFALSSVNISLMKANKCDFSLSYWSSY